MKYFANGFVLILGCFLIMHSVQAREWTPVLSGALQYDVVFPHFGTGSSFNSGWEGYNGRWGSTFDAEMRSQKYGIHVGYHYAGSPIFVHSVGSVTAWLEKRLDLGVRWYPIEQRYFVKPVLGLALTAGRSRKLRYESPWYGQFGASRKSKAYIGQLFEFGVSFGQDHPISAVLMAQVHRFEADFGNDHDGSSGDYYVVIVPSWQIKLQYKLPKIRL
jgi:hypothetical protein